MRPLTSHARALVLFGLVPCLPWPALAQDGEEGSCERVGLSATCHSCSHASFGPFGDVTAQSLGDGPVFASVNAPHTLYRVSLPASGTGTFAGVLAYLSNDAEASDFAVYSDRDIALKLTVAGASEPLAPRLVHDITSAQTDCSTIGYPSATLCEGALGFVKVFRLEPDTEYHLAFGPAPSRSIALVIENLPSLAATYFPDRDGDGHGAPEGLLSTWCVAPMGMIADDTDCDDTRADVRPLATEVCNGIDDDCDGQVDTSECPDDPASVDASTPGPQDGSAAPGDAGVGRPADDAGGVDAPPPDAPPAGDDMPAPASSGCAIAVGKEAMTLWWLVFLSAVLRGRRVSAPRPQRSV